MTLPFPSTPRESRRDQRLSKNGKLNPVSRIPIPSVGILSSNGGVKARKPKEENAKARLQKRRCQLGDAIKAQRKLLGLTRKELANRAHVSISTIEKVEAGRLESVVWTELYAIGVALGVSMELEARRREIR